MNGTSIQISRFILGFSWVYHGLFPKLLWVSPTEKALTATLGFSEQASYLITKSVGIGEIIFGIGLFLFYKNRRLILLNIFALVALLFFVIINMPLLLIDAFNPATTNIALIGLSLVLLSDRAQRFTKSKTSL